jgi:hypothetical protein
MKVLAFIMTLLLFVPAYATEGQRYEASVAKFDEGENAATDKVAPPTARGSLGVPDTVVTIKDARPQDDQSKGGSDKKDKAASAPQQKARPTHRPTATTGAILAMAQSDPEAVRKELASIETAADERREDPAPTVAKRKKSFCERCCRKSNKVQPSDTEE